MVAGVPPEVEKKIKIENLLLIAMGLGIPYPGETKSKVLFF